MNNYFTMSQKIYFPVLEEICNNVVPHWSANLTCCNHSITSLIFFAKKTLQIRPGRDQFSLYMEPAGAARIFERLWSLGIDSKDEFRQPM